MKNESWFPLGIPWKQERFLLWTGLLLSAGAGLVLFLCQYLPARRALYGYDGPLLCFLALALSLAGVAVYHFLCHYQGGRSIYRMRLLPQFGELWRRCLSAPALALLLGAALTAAVILLCALCYYHLTPAGHLPPEPWGGLPLGWIGGNHA